MNAGPLRVFCTGFLQRHLFRRSLLLVLCFIALSSGDRSRTFPVIAQTPRPGMKVTSILPIIYLYPEINCHLWHACFPNYSQSSNEVALYGRKLGIITNPLFALGLSFSKNCLKDILSISNHILIFTVWFPSIADSFISIKFEDNGRASWDKGSSWTSSDVFELPSIQCLSKEINVDNKSVVEHAKSRTAVLRWRKRIGHLLQLLRWRRSRGANMGTKVEAGGVEGRKDWMRAITKRKTRQGTAFSKA